MPIITETIPSVVPYTTTPTRTSPSTFFEDRETRLQEEETRIPQQNAQAESINTFATQANSLKDEVNIARDEAVASANVATAGVNYKGDWVENYNTTGYSLNMSVSYTDGYNYRSKVNNNLVEPTSQTNTANWDYIEAVSPAQLANKVDKVASTDNAIPKFDGTTGAIQNTGVILDDNNFITSQIFNQNGTEFDGVEYFDAGLLGVPDASFSSTGARIYPDGTIRGKSDLGEYVKYPDGRLYFIHSVLVTSTGSFDNAFGSTSGTTYYGESNNMFPHAFIKEPEVVVNGNGAALGYLATYRKISNTEYGVLSITRLSGNINLVSIIGKGSWK